ncbi:MAG: sensor domain-containing protein [Nocardia sp.]|nr:sensor domain-containing protein [Nocardia sp.]
MRTAAFALAAVGACAALSGCGDSHHNSLPALGSTVPAPPITAPAITDPEALHAQLLGPADVPPSFTALDDPAPGKGNSSSAPDRSHTDPAQCAKVLSPMADLAPGPAAQAAVHYSSPNFASIDIDAASYADGAAARAFAAVQQLARECRDYSGTDADGTAMTYQLGGLSQPTVGNASTSFQVRTTSSGMSLYSAATVAIVGSSVVQIAETSPAAIDPAALRDLTDKQIRRLQGLNGP